MGSLTTHQGVTRVELVDDRGRAYVAYGVEVAQTSLQDDSRTLKIFVKGAPIETTILRGVDSLAN